MNTKQILFAIILLISFTGAFLSPAALAATANKCGGVDTALINCTQTGGEGSTVEQTGIWGLLLIAINILTAGVGVAAVGGVVYGSILYTTSGGSADGTKKGIGVITNTVIGLIAWGLMFAILNYIIPGGLLAA